MLVVSGALVAVAAVLAIVGLFASVTWTYSSLVLLCLGAALLPLAVARRVAARTGGATTG